MQRRDNRGDGEGWEEERGEGHKKDFAEGPRDH